MHAVPMMSEWGATDNLTAIKIDAASADRHLMGWTHWAYKFWNDPTTADGDQGLFARRRGPLLGEAGQGCGCWSAPTRRPWPARRWSMRFRPGSGRFWFRFRPDPVDRPRRRGSS